MFLSDIIEIEFKENIRTNKFNLSFFLFERPKNNRRMTIHRCSRDLFMRHYRDWIISVGGSGKPKASSDPLQSTRSRGSLLAFGLPLPPQEINYSINLYFFSFGRPKKNRRITIHRCSRDHFTRNYRDWIKEKHKNK